MYESTPNMTSAYTSSMAYATATSSVAGDAVSAVSRQMTLVQKLLAEHRELQVSAEQRLHAVLRPTAPVPAGNVDQAATRSTLSPLVNDLEGFAAALQQLLSGYQDILNRLEL